MRETERECERERESVREREREREREWRERKKAGELWTYVSLNEGIPVVMIPHARSHSLQYHPVLVGLRVWAIYLTADCYRDKRFLDRITKPLNTRTFMKCVFSMCGQTSFR